MLNISTVRSTQGCKRICVPLQHYFTVPGELLYFISLVKHRHIFPEGFLGIDIAKNIQTGYPIL